MQMDGDQEEMNGRHRSFAPHAGFVVVASVFIVMAILN